MGPSWPSIPAVVTIDVRVSAEGRSRSHPASRDPVTVR
jgi:hypothetical protein